jgi:hypothetical protein
LATGQITVTDTPLVERREPEDFPASILITWPQMPSMIDPRRFGATAKRRRTPHGYGHHKVGGDPST